jgi:hypothetical protein
LLYSYAVVCAGGLFDDHGRCNWHWLVGVDSEHEGVGLSHVAVHVGVGGVLDVSRFGESGVSVDLVAFNVVLLDLLVGQVLHDLSLALVLEIRLAVSDNYGHLSDDLNLLVDGNNLLNLLKHDLGHHFCYINHMQDLFVHHDSNLFLIRNHNGHSDLFGHRNPLDHSLHGILNLGRRAAALG